MENALCVLKLNFCTSLNYFTCTCEITFLVWIMLENVAELLQTVLISRVFPIDSQSVVYMQLIFLLEQSVCHGKCLLLLMMGLSSVTVSDNVTDYGWTKIEAYI